MRAAINQQLVETGEKERYVCDKVGESVHTRLRGAMPVRVNQLCRTEYVLY